MNRAIIIANLELALEIRSRRMKNEKNPRVKQILEQDYTDLLTELTALKSGQTDLEQKKK